MSAFVISRGNDLVDDCFMGSVDEVRCSEMMDS